MLRVAKVFPGLWKGVEEGVVALVVQLAEALPYKLEGHGFQY